MALTERNRFSALKINAGPNPETQIAPELSALKAMKDRKNETFLSRCYRAKSAFN